MLQAIEREFDICRAELSRAASTSQINWSIHMEEEDGHTEWFCRNFYEWLQKGLSLDTIMQQVKRIAEMRIDHWFQIDAF
jgi:hypothetical protein